MCEHLELPMADVVSAHRAKILEETINTAATDIPTLLKDPVLHQIFNEDELL